jgi:hypothetical protein
MSKEPPLDAACRLMLLLETAVRCLCQHSALASFSRLHFTQHLLVITGALKPWNRCLQQNLIVVHYECQWQQAPASAPRARRNILQLACGHPVCEAADRVALSVAAASHCAIVHVASSLSPDEARHPERSGSHWSLAPIPSTPRWITCSIS